MDQRFLSLAWQHPGRSTRALIDLDAISDNVHIIRRLVGANVCVMAVVKANAYGHGAIAVARTALESGASYLGVATIDEGVQLRTAGIEAPILALGPSDESEIEIAIKRRITPMAGDLQFAGAVAQAAEHAEATTPIELHLKVDTGMRRFGANPEDVLALARYIADHRLLRLGGVATHYAQADEEDELPTNEQSALFDKVLGDLAERGIVPDLVHSANSAAALRSRAHDRNLVRLGIGLYGLSPSGYAPVIPPMRPAMSIVSRVRRIFEIAPGNGVSYGATYRAKTYERLALVPIGYGDGYRRSLSNKGWMSINGIRCPVRGRVCMDQTLVGIPDTLDIRLGQPVVVGGALGDDSAPSIDELAAMTGTINYEIVTGIARRVPRVFIRSGRVVGIEDLGGYRQIPETQLTDV